MSAAPYNLEAEQAVLGSMLLDAGAAGEGLAQLRGKDFYREQHTLIFEAIAELSKRGQPVDVVTVTDRLRGVGRLDDAGGVSYVTSLIHCTFSPSMLSTYTRLVKRDAGRRALRELGLRLVQASRNGQGQESLVAEASGELVMLNRLLAEGRSVGVKTGGLEFSHLGDLLAQPYEAVRWLVDGRLPAAGLSLLAGRPKAGKSTLARCLALAVARGEPWLGFVTQQGAVLYLALEEKTSEVRRHFEAMEARADDPVYVHCARVPQEGIVLLREAAEQHRPGLIIVDPLLRLVRVRDANDYALMTAALEPLLALARETGAHVLAVHHLGKNDRQGGDGILGSTAIYGAVDTALILKRSEKYRTLSSIQRYGDDLEEILLAFDAETRLITAGPSRQQADEAHLADTILEYLGACAEPVDEAAIQEAVEGRRAVKVKALRHLVEKGRVIRSGQGRRGDPYLYVLEDSGFLVPNVSKESAEPETLSVRPTLTIPEGQQNLAKPTPARPEPLRGIVEA